MGAAVDLFCAAKAAEGASPRTLEGYRMILIRAVRWFGEARPVDAVPAAELRAWLLELRASLAPESIAGYVRGLKAFGNWCAAEEVATAGGFRGLRRPKVPHRLIAPFSDPELRSLLALADERERALALVLLDTGLRLSELASLRVGDVRPDGTLHVMGKGAKERIVSYVTQQARNLVMSLAAEGTQVGFLIRDRDAKFSRSFDDVFASEGIRVIRTPIRAPNANAFAERWIATLRAECLDWLLILGPRHLDRVLRIYVQHYNRRRPHRGLDLRVPESLTPVEAVDGMPDVERRDLLGGLVHEYMKAA